MNLNREFSSFFSFALVLLTLFSCAKENSITQDAMELQILESHVRVVYKDTLHKTSSGAYYYTIAKGDGKEITDECSIMVNMSTMTLKYNYYPSESGVFSGMSTNRVELAKQIGEYNVTYYYGERLFDMAWDGYYPLANGVKEALMDKREGGSFRIFVPSWASVVDGHGKTNSATVVYDIEIIKVLDNYYEYQMDSLKRFSEKYYGGIDTVFNGLYVKTLVDGMGDTLSSGSRADIRYVGKLLNGFVFDTNIEDTARMYRIYNSDNSYEEASLTVLDYVENNSSTDTDEIDLPDGVKWALRYMKPGEKAVVFFHSVLGYHVSASWWNSYYYYDANIISPKQYGGWQPLLYYIEIVNTDNSDGDEEEEEG